MGNVVGAACGHAPGSRRISSCCEEILGPLEGPGDCYRLGYEQAERLAAHPGSLGPPALAWTTAVGLKIEQPATGTAETAHA
jgi:hypothetical protein